MVLLTIASLITWADDRPVRLPGSDLSVVRAERRALYVVEARILRLGPRRPDRSQDRGLSYPEVFIEPSRAIKGARWWTAVASPKLELLLTQNDTVPSEGEVYVLYIESANRGLHVFKVTRPGGAIPMREVGSDVGVAEAREAALHVVDAEVRDLGNLEWDPDRPPRGLIHPRVAIAPSAVIKGADKAAALAIRSVRLPFRRDGADLEQGRSYTLYLRETGRGTEVFKATPRIGDRSERLPGSDLSAAEAESRALYVVEARILHLGELQEDGGRPRGLVYPHVAIEQSKVIKERHGGAARSGRDVRLILTEDEAIPREGVTYALYVRGKDRGFEVFKVMHPSPEKPN